MSWQHLRGEEVSTQQHSKLSLRKESNQSSDKYIAPIFIAGLCICGMTYNQGGRQLLPPLLVAIRREFSLTHLQSSALMTVFSMVYAVVQALVGMLSRVVGRRRMLVFSTIAYAIVLMITSLIHSYETLLILQVAGALTAGVYFITGLSIIAGLSSASKHKGLIMGFYLSATSLGAVLSSGMSGLALKYWSWRIAYLVWGLVGIPVGLLMLKYLPNDGELVEDTDLKARRPVLSGGAITVTYVLLVISLMLNSIKVWGLNTFLCSFLSEAKGFTQASAAALYGGIRAIGVLGQTTMGIMLDSMGKLETAILTTGLGAFAVCLPLLNYGRPFLFVTLVIYGFASPMAFGAVMASIHDSTPPESWDAVTGFANALSFVGAAVGPAMVGRMIDSSGFNTAFLTTAALSGLGCLIAYFARMTNKPCKHVRTRSQ